MTLTPGSDDHWRQWLARYGDDYDTDQERRAAYREALDTLATLTAAADRLDPTRGQ